MSMFSLHYETLLYARAFKVLKNPKLASTRTYASSRQLLHSWTGDFETNSHLELNLL